MNEERQANEQIQKYGFLTVVFLDVPAQKRITLTQALDNGRRSQDRPKRNKAIRSYFHRVSSGIEIKSTRIGYMSSRWM